MRHIYKLRFKEVVTKSKDELIGLGFPQFTLEDFHETVELTHFGIQCQIPPYKHRDYFISVTSHF